MRYEPDEDEVARRIRESIREKEPIDTSTLAHAVALVLNLARDGIANGRGMATAGADQLGAFVDVTLARNQIFRLRVSQTAGESPR